eukprot:3851281-Rhodomonas_salina.1
MNKTIEEKKKKPKHGSWFLQRVKKSANDVLNREKGYDPTSIKNIQFQDLLHSVYEKDSNILASDLAKYVKELKVTDNIAVPSRAQFKF